MLLKGMINISLRNSQNVDAKYYTTNISNRGLKWSEGLITADQYGYD